MDRFTTEDEIIQTIFASCGVMQTVVPSWGRPEEERLLVAYASGQFTTGERGYRVARALGMTSLSAFQTCQPDLFRTLVIERNVTASHLFTTRLRERHTVVVNPHVFCAAGWKQLHYMALWERIIRRLVHVIYFNHGWHFSSGCVEEYLIGQTIQATMYDHRLRPLDIGRENERLRHAIAILDGWGFDAMPLYNLYRRIMMVKQ